MQLRIDQVFQMTGLSQTAIYAKGENGTFPKRFKIDHHHVRWNSEEVEEWIRENLKRLASFPQD